LRDKYGKAKQFIILLAVFSGRDARLFYLKFF